MKVGSLFSGFGLMDLGLQQAGMEIAWQCENNKYAQKVLEKHWPGLRRWDDVRTFPPEPIEEWRVDLIAGGDPCQENSNSRKNGRCSQPSLGGEFIRIIDALRPRLVLRENPSAVRSDAPWPWQRFRRKLEKIGYAVLPFRLRACCLGANHRRDRLFLLAEFKDSMRPRLERPWSPRKLAFDACRSIRGIGLSESDLVRKRNGMPNYVERIRGLGNGVFVPCAQWIGERIMEAEANR